MPVPLGTHTFGHLASSQAIVAKAGPKEVGWESPPPGADGVSFGPWSFDIARDGSIWLLDEVNQRLLLWQPGRPDRPGRTVPLPFKAAVDLALDADGTIYVTSMPAGGSGHYLYALTPTGQVRWKILLPEQRAMGSLLVADGVVYHHFTSWTPMTDSHGQPLPAAEQRRLASPHQPLPGGLQLSEELATPHEVRLSLIDKPGHVVRGWRITSQTELGGVAAKAALVHDDLMVMLHVTEQTKTKFQWECLVLRLAPTEGTRLRFAIAPESRVMWGSEHITGLRVGPDGQLYQLRSDRVTGVSIARYSLTPHQDHPTDHNHPWRGRITLDRGAITGHQQPGPHADGPNHTTGAAPAHRAAGATAAGQPVGAAVGDGRGGPRPAGRHGRRLAVVPAPAPRRPTAARPTPPSPLITTEARRPGTLPGRQPLVDCRHRPLPGWLPADIG
jgi:hypothetical protein